MATSEQKKNLLKAKIAVALRDELGRVPKTEEIGQVFLFVRVIHKAVLASAFSEAGAEEARPACNLLNFFLKTLFLISDIPFCLSRPQEV